MENTDLWMLFFDSKWKKVWRFYYDNKKWNFEWNKSKSAQSFLEWALGLLNKTKPKQKIDDSIDAIERLMIRDIKFWIEELKDKFINQK